MNTHIVAAITTTTATTTATITPAANRTAVNIPNAHQNHHRYNKKQKHQKSHNDNEIELDAIKNTNFQNGADTRISIGNDASDDDDDDDDDEDLAATKLRSLNKTQATYSSVSSNKTKSTNIEMAVKLEPQACINSSGSGSSSSSSGSTNNSIHNNNGYNKNSNKINTTKKMPTLPAVANNRLSDRMQMHSVDVTTATTTTTPNNHDDVDNADDCQLHLHNHRDEQCSNIPLVDISRDDSGEQSDISLESSEDTDSSTPTTADIADLTTNSTNSTIYLITKRKLSRSPFQQVKGESTRLGIVTGGGGGGASATTPIIGDNFSGALSSNNGSIADDNLSASIATTTTEIDIDNVTVASPNISLGTTSSTTRLHMCTRLSAPQAATLNSSSPSSSSNANLVSDNAIGAAAAQHPSAAYLQSGGDARQCDTAIVTAAGHKRTLSAASYKSTASQHPSLSAVSVHSVHSRLYNWIRWICVYFKSSGIGEPSVYHALVVIFLEFFAWGLLTMPVISVLNQTFPDHTFLMNGLVMGIKGILSFLSAPLIGALSDIWGRKFFLLITVFFTCAPIPLMTINSWWFFAMISISGIFAVTFSVVFAYVADVTTVEERSRAYGLVSATFAASLVISPALGAALMEMYSDTLVVALATAIAVLDVFFILVAVPESLPEKVRPSSWGAPISWEQADPFAALRKVGTDHTILMQCVTVLLSYLPEAGQYSCIFVYLKLKMGFNIMEVAIFIAVVGILSIGIQVTLGYLMRVLGAKRTILLGLVLEMMQLLWYGFGSQKWMMWAAGILAALGSITYPAISAFVSIHSTPDRQGAVQGMVTGMRGLCNGLGPAMFGVIFYLFNVDLNDDHAGVNNGGAGGNAGINGNGNDIHSAAAYKSEKYAKFIPGPPFVFGALMVILAILVAIFIPDGRSEIVGLNHRVPSDKKRISLDVQYEIETGHKTTGPLAPLMRSDSLAQL